MGKINRLARALGLILRQPALLNHVINDDDVWQRYVQKHHSMGHGLPVVDISHLVNRFSGELPLFSFLDGGSLPTDILLLKKLAESIEDCRFFFFFSWRGESVANIAPVAKECYTLNLSAEELKYLGFKEKYAGLQDFFSKKIPNITHLKGDSRSFDFAGLNRKFDLIFIDGDHHYDFVKNDTRRVVENLIHDKTIIVWHDYAFNPEKTRFEVMAGILDGLPKEMYTDLYHVSNTLTAIYYPGKKLPSNPLDAPVKPDHVFEVSLKYKKIG